MKMKRSEKLGMLTGLVVGVLLLLISVFMIFQTTCKVWGSQITPTQAEKNGLENSFRYTDGKLKSTTERMTRSLTRVVKPSNATAQGIDVSYHQGTIDWEKVAVRLILRSSVVELEWIRRTRMIHSGRTILVNVNALEFHMEHFYIPMQTL